MESEKVADASGGDYPDIVPTNEGVAKRHTAACAERGCLVVLPLEKELFVDIDTFQALGYFHANVRRLGDLYESHTLRPSPSRKDGRFHIVVQLSRPVRDAFERIMLQALLGSDLSREILSWREATAGVVTPTVFFEKLPTAK